MSKRIISTTLALSLMLAAPFAVAQEKSSAEAAKAPRLTLVEPVKDFGTVPRGQKLDWSFEIKNTGTTDLEILAAKPTCGCTVADFDKLIKPGSTGKLTAHVDTTGFAGPISKAVTLETNDPAAPTAQVTITALVKPYVEAYPAGFVRFNLTQGETLKQSLLLYTEETEPFEIVSIEAPQDWIRVDYSKAAGEDIRQVGRPNQAQYVLDVTVGGTDLDPGPLAEKIRVVTNSKHQPDYFINVTGVIRPSYRMDPPSGVNFGEVTPAGEGSTRVVKLRSNSLKTPENFAVTKVESGVAGVNASVSAAGKGIYDVKLSIDKDAKPGMLDGNITVYTNDIARPTTTIPIKGLVKTASVAAAPASSK